MGESNTFKIESNDLTISQILKDFYTVPDFQREYVWERKQVEKLLQDILDEFYDEDGKIIEGPEYFLGSVVACKDKTDSIYQLIDGQQRLTTIYLILCAAREALKEAGEEPTRVLLGQISDVYADSRTGEDVERQRLTLQYEDSDGILEKIKGSSLLLTHAIFAKESRANLTPFRPHSESEKVNGVPHLSYDSGCPGCTRIIHY